MIIFIVHCVTEIAIRQLEREAYRLFDVAVIRLPTGSVLMIIPITDIYQSTPMGLLLRISQTLCPTVFI